MRMIVILSILCIASPLWAQAQRPYSPPRMPDGHPDLQGTYDLATLTPMERPAGTKAVLSEDEATKLERQVATQTEVRGRAISA